MKKSGLITGILLSAIILIFCAAAAKSTPAQLLRQMHWLGQSALRIETGKQVIYIDPVGINKPVIADVIFITHDHPDHLSVTDVKKITGPETVIIASKTCLKKLKGYKVAIATPGDMGEIKGIKYEVVPAYNTKHPKEKEFAGYVITIDGQRLYHAGDTGAIPEMKELKDIAVACVPIGGVFTMNYKEAAGAVNSFSPAIAVPMHFNNILGGPKAPGMFIVLLEKGIKGELMVIEDQK